MNLEQTIEKSFMGKVGDYLQDIRHSFVYRVAAYSLVGALSAGSFGYGCGPGEIDLGCFERTFWGNKDDVAFSIQQTTDGGYVVAGQTASKGVGKDDAWILKLDSNGDLEWDKTFGGSDSDSAHSVRQTFDGGYIVAGMTGSKGAGDYDAWVLKLDSNGELDCE